MARMGRMELDTAEALRGMTMEVTYRDRRTVRVRVALAIMRVGVWLLGMVWREAFDSGQPSDANRLRMMCRVLALAKRKYRRQAEEYEEQARHLRKLYLGAEAKLRVEQMLREVEKNTDGERA